MRFDKIKTAFIFMTLLMKGTFGDAQVPQICDQETCQPMIYFDRQQVLEELILMFKNNTSQILICKADSLTKKCLDQPLTFNGQTNMMQVDFQVPFIRILQKDRLENGLSLALDYQIRANEKYPVCAPSVSHFNFFPKGEITLTSPSFECKATELGKTHLAFQFKIDYINFETGWLGAAYEASSFGDVLGKGNGYVMMRVSSDRSIQPKRRQPHELAADTKRVDFSPSKNIPHESGKLVDWDWDHIKEKWNNFKEKALKIIYLEPLDD